ncbi:hypothetical protein H0H92_003365 [Tricholoma furcatifolium]|nr:hypothetical protein H0H92_003365 [Tricholoma furcatifolium]
MYFLPIDPGRIDRKLALDEFKRSKVPPQPSNYPPSARHPVCKQEISFDGKGSSRFPRREPLQSWQTDVDGSNTRYVGRYAKKFDSEAQGSISSRNCRTFPGHYPLSDEGLEDTEPLPADATPPPTPRFPTIMDLPTSYKPYYLPERIQNNYDHQRMTLERPAHLHVEQPRLVIHQPQPIRPIRFDRWRMFDLEFDQPAPPDPDQVRQIAVQCVSQTYSDYLRFRQRMSDPVEPKRDRGNVEEQSRYQPTSHSQIPQTNIHHMHTSHQARLPSIAPSKFEDEDTGSDSGYSSFSDRSKDLHSLKSQFSELSVSNRLLTSKPSLPRANWALKVDSDSAHLQRNQGREDHEQQYSRPPTHYGVFRCLDRVGKILRRIEDFRPKLNQDLDDVEDALCSVESCLRRQRRLTHEQWAERYDTWDIKFSQRTRNLTSCIKSIEQALEEGGEFDEFHDIHLLGEEAADLANQLHVSVDNLRKQILEKQSKTWK